MSVNHRPPRKAHAEIRDTCVSGRSHGVLSLRGGVALNGVKKPRPRCTGAHILGQGVKSERCQGLIYIQLVKMKQGHGGRGGFSMPGKITASAHIQQ